MMTVLRCQILMICRFNVDSQLTIERLRDQLVCAENLMYYYRDLHDGDCLRHYSTDEIALYHPKKNIITSASSALEMFWRLNHGWLVLGEM